MGPLTRTNRSGSNNFGFNEVVEKLRFRLKESESNREKGKYDKPNNP
jgi:hypothetical protein